MVLLTRRTEGGGVGRQVRANGFLHLSPARSRRPLPLRRACIEVWRTNSADKSSPAVPLRNIINHVTVYGHKELTMKSEWKLPGGGCYITISCVVWK